MKRELGTIVTAMVTPFDERGDLDLREAGRLARWLVERGNDGLVVAGSTGEGQTLDSAERVALWKAVKEAVGRDAAVIANAGTNSTRESVGRRRGCGGRGRRRHPCRRALLQQADTERNARALRGDRAGRCGFRSWSTTSRAERRPTCCPRRCSSWRGRHTNVAGVKESSGDLKQIGLILRGRDDGFIVWAGDDHLFLPCLSLGADGVVGVASHLCSREYRRMLDAYRDGRVDEAARIHASLLPLIDALFATTSPIPVKWAMRQLGFRGRRMPLAARRHAGVRRRSAASAARAVCLACRFDVAQASRNPVAPDWRFSDAVSMRSTRMRRPLGSWRWRAEAEGAQVVTLGTEMVVYAQRDARFRATVNACALSLCDTVGLLAVARRRGARAARARHRRRAGRSALRGRGGRRSAVYFLGGATGVAADAAAIFEDALSPSRRGGRARRVFRGRESADVAAAISPPAARACSSRAWARRVKSTGWPSTIRQTGCGVGIGVGGSFDVIAGRVRRAPAFGSPHRSRVAVSPGQGTASLAAAVRAAAVRLAGRARRSRACARATAGPAREGHDPRRRTVDPALSADQARAQAARSGRRRAERGAPAALPEGVRIRRGRDEPALSCGRDRLRARRRIAVRRQDSLFARTRAARQRGSGEESPGVLRRGDLPGDRLRRGHRLEPRPAVDFHRERDALASIALVECDDVEQYGVVVLDERGKISGFQEKPARGSERSKLVNTGVYVFSPRDLRAHSGGRVLRLRQAGVPIVAGGRRALLRIRCARRILGRHRHADRISPCELRRRERQSCEFRRRAPMA